MGNEMEMFEQLLSAASLNYNVPYLIATLVMGLLSALLGFRLLKLMIILSAFSYGYTLGANTLGIGLKELVAGFDISIVLGILVGIVFALITLKIYKCIIYFIGGYLGVIFGFIIPVIIFDLVFNLSGVGIIVGIILAIVLAVPSAKIFYRKLFKPFYILSASFSGMMNVGMCAAMLFTTDTASILMAMGIGFILGIPAAIYQFKANRDRTVEDIFN